MLYWKSVFTFCYKYTRGILLKNEIVVWSLYNFIVKLSCFYILIYFCSYLIYLQWQEKVFPFGLSWFCILNLIINCDLNFI